MLMERRSDSEMVYYSEISLPWPLSNRDFCSDTRVWMDEGTRQLADLLPQPCQFRSPKGPPGTNPLFDGGMVHHDAFPRLFTRGIYAGLEPGRRYPCLGRQYVLLRQALSDPLVN